MQENISEILKTCKKHGQLTIQQINKRPSGDIRCKACENESRERRKVKNYIPEVDSVNNAGNEIYDRLLMLQGRKCVICGDLEKYQKDGKLIIDYHPAIKNMARGLICKECNSIIKNSRGSPEILQRFMKYFEEVPYSNYASSVENIILVD